MADDTAPWEADAAATGSVPAPAAPTASAAPWEQDAAVAPPATPTPATPPDIAAAAGKAGDQIEGVGDIALTSALNIPSAAAHSVVHLARRILGNGASEEERNAPSWADKVPSAKLGASGEALVKNVAQSDAGQAVKTALSDYDKQLGAASPTLQDVAHQTLGVAGDVANLVPAAAAVEKIRSLAGDIRGARAVDAAATTGEAVVPHPAQPGGFTADDLLKAPEEHPPAAVAAPKPAPRVAAEAAPADEAGIAAGLKGLDKEGKLHPKDAGQAEAGKNLADAMQEDLDDKPAFEAVPPGKSNMTTGKGPFTILSAERGERTPAENVLHTTKLDQQLRALGLPHEPTDGVYMGGTPEKGFAVSTDTPASQATVEQLAKLHDQESVLHVGANGDGKFKYTTGEKAGTEEPMGNFQMVPKDEAEKAVGFTRDTNGNHYVLKAPSTETPLEQAADSRAPAAAAAPAPVANQPLSFRRPADEGAVSGELPPAEQAARQQILASQGIDDVRHSAITGDTKAAGSDFQTAKLDNNYGKRMSQVINGERSAIRNGADSLVERAGGSDGMEGSDLYNRGGTIGKAADKFDDYLTGEISKNYDEATARLGGKPIPALTETQNYMKANKSNFLGTVEGKQLLEGIEARMKELGFKGDNDTFNPPSVEQAERFRQYLGEQWTPRTGRLVSALKDSLDNDVAAAAGEDVYQKARALNAMRDNLVRSPKLVSSLLAPADGLNRSVPIENIPKTITSAPVDQVQHLVTTLKKMGKVNPELAQSSADALNEVRSQFANEYRAAGNTTEGMWNAKGGSKYLQTNNMKMASVFSPEEMQAFKNHNDAAAILKMDRSYPGAAAQKHNFVIGGALKGVEHLGGVAGATMGHIPGAVVGLGAQKVAGKIDDALMERNVESRIVNLSRLKEAAVQAHDKVATAAESLQQPQGQ